MPFYEYQCRQCGHELEVLQKISDKPLRQCPECGKAALTKLVSAPIFRLKGGGWYETDFKSEQDKKRNLAGDPEPKAESKSDDKAGDNADKKADAKTDIKADAKTDTKAEPKPAAKPKTKAKAKATAKSGRKSAARR
ncbi:MAG: FmdB family zinc ribbon protein [Steroidobacteraceae bacterium]